jgi:hypothetical protein
MKTKLYTTLAIAVLAIGVFLPFCLTTTTAAIDDTYTLTVNIDGTGCSVTQNVTQETYAYQDVIELTAVPAEGWSFTEWTGDLASTDNPTTITLESNATVTAVFTQDTYTLTMYTVGNGTVTPGNQTYLSGTEVTLEAINDENFTFSGWSGDITGTTNTTITMNGNKTITATFALPEESTPTATPTPTPSPTPAPTTTTTSTSTPTASPTPEPTTAPLATAQPTPATSRPAQASLTAYFTIFAAIIIMGALAFIVVSRMRHSKQKA